MIVQKKEFAPPPRKKKKKKGKINKKMFMFSIILGW